MMARVVGLVAYHVFKESVRDKVLYNLVLFAVLLIGGSYLVGQLTAGQDIKIIKDLGLAASSLFGLFIAVFIGVGLVWKEVDRRSVYNLLVKPVRRHEFILGKFLGLALTLLVNIAVMAAALYAVLALMSWLRPEIGRAGGVEAPVLDPRLLKAFGLLYAQLLVVTSVALFFSTFAGPLMSAAFTFGLYVVGHFNEDLAHFEDVVQSPAAGWLGKALYYLLPNLAPFDVKLAAVHGREVPNAYCALTAAYGLLYIAAMLALAVVIFQRRDFK
ncbi:MAG TPA: ABC transporter permease subunit [Vicinamibacterales bacterium]|nr:ABC transporter permease subunit [Vicinamibacterales bacterium]HOQ59939.1 ABC transporter permease subunit [Vicinamibacterales bacterium]HPK71892.1 ABC transporter permease subunit [Vicinamibacterales bacterium]